MLSANTLVFGKKLKGLSVESSGKAPIGGVALKEEMNKSYQAGYQAASDKFNAQLLEMRAQMQGHAQGVLQKIEEAYARLEKTISNELPELIIAGVYKIIGENAMPAELLKARIEAVMAESCPANEAVVVSVSQQDLEALKAIDEALVTNNARITFKVDEKLSPGDCLMQTKFGQVDARLKTQFGRLREELGAV